MYMCYSRDINGNTPLHLAAVSGYTRTMLAILSVHNHLVDAANKAKVGNPRSYFLRMYFKDFIMKTFPLHFHYHDLHK